MSSKRLRLLSIGLNSFDRGFLSGLLAGVLISTFLFVSIALVCVVLFPSTSWAAVQTDDTSGQVKPEIEPRPIGEIRRDLKAFMKRSKTQDDPSAQACAIVDLCLLHQEIVNDQRFTSNDQLIGFRAIAATRLKKYQKELELLIKREARAEAKEAKNETPKFDDSESDNDRFGSAGDKHEMSYETYHEIVAGEFESMSQFTGGPILLWSHIGGSYGPLGDYSEQLVDLIQSTINPDFWRANGGEGIIHFYRPSCVLFVGATSRVHDDLTDMLRTLRQLSR